MPLSIILWQQKAADSFSNTNEIAMSFLPVAESKNVIVVWLLQRGKTCN